MDLISEQYKDSRNYVARIEINRKFRTNPQPWTSWLFDQINFQERSRVLELGCGNAILWKTNQDKIGSHQQIVLTDFSEGMLEDAQKVLGNMKNRFEYEVMDAQNINHPKNSFSIVIANLMLYHVPNRRNAFSEITCVLTDEGLFYASTFGKNNMNELNDLVQDIIPELNTSLETLSNQFGLENGKSQLEDYFGQIELIKYPDHLEITEAQPIIDYLLSFGRNRSSLDPEQIESLKKYLEDEIDSEGCIKVTKDTGVFIAKNPPN